MSTPKKTLLPPLQDKPVTFKIISEYRSSLMGLSILWIFLFHSQVYFPAHPLFHPLRLLVSSGYGGVDMFLFLSGYGLMYSRTIHPGAKTLAFYRTRLQKIYPSFFLATLLTLSVDFCLTGSLTVMDTILALTTLGFWTTKSMLYWFVAVIFSLYLIFPLFCLCYNKKRDPALLFFVIFPLVISALLSSVDQCHFIRYFARIPTFFIGAQIGYVAANADTRLEIRHLILLAAFLLVSTVILGVILFFNISPHGQSCGLLFLPTMLGTLPLCVFSAMILRQISATRVAVINKAFSFLGLISLEIYLVHKQIVFRVGDFFIEGGFGPWELNQLVFYGHYLRYLLYFAVTLLLALALQKVSLACRPSSSSARLTRSL